MKWTYQEAQELSDTYGDAFYVFDRDRFVSNFNAFLSAFASHYDETRIGYSYKTNYTPVICKLVDRLGGYAEVVSAMELELAMQLGVDGSRIIYNGPYKSVESMRSALCGGAVVNLDSARDLATLQKVAREGGITGRVGVRCNFDIGSGRVSRFGMDVEGDEFADVCEGVRNLDGVTLAGLHCHFQDRDLETFDRRMRALLDTVERTFESAPVFLDIGGGYFGCLPESLRSQYGGEVPSYEDYGRVLGELMDRKYPEGGPRPILFTEPGTALVADTFEFITRVTGCKSAQGKEFAFVAGSIFNTSPYARVTSLPVTVLRCGDARRGRRTVDVCGYTCIETDVLSHGLDSDMAAGDFLVYGNVGSYSVGMKPPFIMPNVPILMHEDGRYRLIKRAETTDDLFRSFEWT